VTESLRVVLVTDADAQIPTFFNELMRANGHRLVGVVTGPGPKNRRSTTYLEIVRATPPGIDVIVTTHPERLARMLEPLKPDLIWALGFLRVLPQDVLDLPRLGVINSHGGVLPRYRGPNPAGWAFRNDDGKLGWTIHRMTGEIDEGPILALGTVSYGDDDDFESVFPQWVGLLPGLIAEALPRIIAGDPGELQNKQLAGYAPPFEDSWREIDWSQPARTIHNQVRSQTGSRGMPSGALGTIDGARQVIYKTRLITPGSERNALPGTLLVRGDDRLVIQCGDGPLEILKWDPAA
jgi:methionyl-tRNA formyltransferase